MYFPDLDQPKNCIGEVVDGKLYVFGGQNFFTSKKIHAYDIEEKTWTYVGDMPYRISYCSVSRSGKYIWLAGSDDNMSLIAAYDTQDKTFTTIYSNMIGRSKGGLGVLGDQSIV